DAYAAARHLQQSGARVALFHLGDPSMLKGDAARARIGCELKGQELDLYRPETGDVVIVAGSAKRDEAQRSGMKAQSRGRNRSACP
ncbi:hypothetical protein ACC674_38290, partial [Rhizobium ruizarguesonis]